MSTQNIGFYEEITKIIPYHQLSSNTHFISSSGILVSFFQHGKDFDSIHNLIVSKCKRRGGSQPIAVKNKEQVRHFYYRTWHKISKLIEPVEGRY